MATVSVPRLSTINGESVEELAEVEVSAEVAALLAQREPALKEKPYADLAGANNERGGLDPDTLTVAAGHRRQNNRPMPAGNSWEGPRFHFDLLLGLSRADWHGEDIRDEQGRCDLCHDAELGTGAYCLNCQRCGREHEIEPLPKTVRRTLEAALFNGRPLKGGTGAKPRKASKKAAKKAVAKKKAARVGSTKYGKWEQPLDRAG